MKLKGKKIIVTGGSRGIGRAIALGVAKEGADVIITYQKERQQADDTVKLMTEKGVSAKALQLNITNTQSFNTFFKNVLDFFGEIHVLFNNAGIVKRTKFLEVTEEELDEIFNTNFKGTYLLTKLIANQMKNQGKGGSIVNISSISDEIPTEGLTHYQSSKAAITMFTKGIALELAKYNIRVNTLSPGLTKTDINKSQWENDIEAWNKRVAQTPLQRPGSPQDYVGMAVLLASDESAWITGSRIAIDGGRSLV